MSSTTTNHDGEREEREVEVSIARLPVTGRDLFGRAADLAWLDACWQERAHVASVVAWGGVGKSALVNAWLAAVRDEGWRGARRVFGWSFYSQGTDRLGSSDEFFAEALRWFGEDGAAPTSPWDKGERLARLVRKERTILILDGVEPLQWGPGVQAGLFKDPALEALVKELGAQNKGLCVITSRIALTDLDGLVGGKVRAKDLGHLSAEAGAELLVARGAKGADEELRAAAEEYDGHSLALTLLGTYVRKAHKGDIRQREDIPPLEGQPAHRMMATYERWFAGKPELAILRMLGLFDRPAAVDEIAAVRAKPLISGLTDKLGGVTGARWNEAVTALRDVGLLAEGPDDDDRRDAHPLVREHFGEQLRREQLEAWQEGHRRLYEHLKAKAKPLPETIEEMAPLYAAVVHGCLAGKSQEALTEVFVKRINHGQDSFNWANRGAFGSDLAVLSAFFDPPWDGLAPGLDDTHAVKILNAAGFSLQAHGRLFEAEGLWEQAFERDIHHEDWKGAAQRTASLGELFELRGDLCQAEAKAQKSVAFVDRSNHGFQRLRCRTTLAAILHALGRASEAEPWFAEAMRMQADKMKAARPPAHPLLYSYTGSRHNEMLLDQGRYAEALERATQTLRWHDAEPRWFLDIALDHLSLGRAHLLAAQHGDAGALTIASFHLAHAVEGLRRAARQDYLPHGLLARAALHTHTGTFDLARRDLDEAHTLATRCGFRLHLADAHLGLARLSLAEGHPALPAARDHLATARRIIAETGYHRRDGELAELDAEAAEMAKTAPPVTAPSPPPPATPPLTPAAVPVPEKASPVPAPLKLFYSYSHKDEALREDLETHLKVLQRQGLIEPWTDRAITGGTEWAGAIDEHLENADVILLLVSASFIASDFCFDKELRRAIARHDANEARVVPIFIKPCDWAGTPFSKLQGLPKDTKAVTTWRNLDEAWADVAKGIRRVVEELQKRRAGVTSGAPRHGAQLANLDAEAAEMTKTAPPPTETARHATTPAAPAGALTDVEPHREAMTPAQLLDALLTLLPAQLDMLVFKLTVPVAFLPGANAAPATRCIDVLRWAEQANRLADVARVLADVAGKRTL